MIVKLFRNTEADSEDLEKDILVLIEWYNIK